MKLMIKSLLNPFSFKRISQKTYELALVSLPIASSPPHLKEIGTSRLFHRIPLHSPSSPLFSLEHGLSLSLDTMFHQ